ncbi:MAG: carboxypeptidase regulatory-like domain-containing protein, partial [Acidimicrobiales bacterium]|nr:carboxypeptidase regulatory-like domain-containing protein [Acidimicrobiales bacterium]
DYKLEFVDPSGLHDMEWNDDHPYYDIALADSATAPGVADADLDPRTGAVAGTIVDDTTGDPVEGAWVVAIAPSGIAGGAVTAADGTYTVDGLPAGTYVVTIADPNGGRAQEYWEDSPDYPGATPVDVIAGATATVDAALARP